MRRTIAGLIAACALSGPGTAAADDDCRVDDDPSGQVAKCSAAIADPSLGSADRGIAYLYRCQAHDALGQGAAALQDCLTAADLRGDDPSVHNSLNIVYRGLGRAEDALAAISRALELSPEEGGYLAGRASTFCALGLFTESHSDRLRAMELGYLGAEQVQTVLKDAGFYDGEIDGKFGSGSEAALKAWTEKGC